MNKWTAAGTFGKGLTRPECVWIDHDGIWASDNSDGGVIHVASGRKLGRGIREPNGFSRRADGRFVVAGLVDHRVYEIAPDGTTRVLLSEVGGKPLGVTNYACVDGERVWISIMTDRPAWHDAFNAGPEGSIILLDRDGARVVAEGLHITNEVKVSADGRWLYAVESMGRRIVRFPIRADASLGPRETVGPDDLGHGAFPDGIAFDDAGNLWVTLIARNGIAMIDRSGRLHTVAEEPNADAIDRLMDAFVAKKATVELLAACAGRHLCLPTSLAFQGETMYVGSLPGSSLLRFTRS
jgi:sugar lactone lactonase YvrE